MPLYNLQLDDEVAVDLSVPIAGVNNSRPPSAIDQTEAADTVNRLTQLDALNRPRPGIQRLKHTGGQFDSIHHYGGGQFLVSDGPNWFRYDNRTINISSLTGGPAFVRGDQVYSALCDKVLYFSRGNNLYKYDQTVPGFGTVTLPTQYPSAKWPIWAVQRLIYCYQNTLVVSDILTPETFDVITSSLTLDPIASDAITGQALYQNQRIVVFRNGSTWLVETGPGLAVLDWQLNRISGKVGCRVQGSVVQCGADVYFLSETGRGIYALSQAPASEQQGIWTPLSEPISDYINRINWVAADNVRACFWNALYMIALPLDNSSVNNFILIYSVVLGKWQGLWCFDLGAEDLAFRDCAVDTTDPNETALIIGTSLDGVISRMTYPTELQAYDQNEDGSRDTIDSSLLSRAFTFGMDINRVRPHSIRMQFLESEDPCNVTVFGDRTIELTSRTIQTNSYKLSLPIPGFPFDLDKEGFAIDPIGLLKTGYCHELQVLLEGTGNWTVYMIKAAAFVAPPLISE